MTVIGASSKDSSVGAALQHFLGTSGYSNVDSANDEFVQHYTDNALGFHNDSTHSFQITLGDVDTGAIGGANADGGGIISHKDAVPDSGTGYDPASPSTNPLNKFGLKWEKEGISMNTPNEDGKEMLFQFTNSITIDDKNSYNLRNTSSAQLSLNLLENWLGELNNQTSTVNANLHSLNVSIEKLQNSLASYTSAVSRISDTDYASETTNFVKNQIRAENSVSILSKGNENKISIGELLEGVKIAKSNT